MNNIFFCFIQYRSILCIKYSLITTCLYKNICLYATHMSSIVIQKHVKLFFIYYILSIYIYKNIMYFPEFLTFSYIFMVFVTLICVDFIILVLMLISIIVITIKNSNPLVCRIYRKKNKLELFP
jgi:hypothetical protein